MIKIKICDVAPRSACSYYRGIGVLSQLRHVNPDIHIEYLEAVSWSALADCDILFLLRPVHNNYIESMQLAKNFGVPVWIDFDDCLHEIPDDNPGFKNFNTKAVLTNMEIALKNADIVTVSTIELKNYYSKFNPNIIVVENAFNNYNYKMEKRNNKNKFISWRGSATHRNDLLSCKDEMKATAYKNDEWEWVFIGDNIWYITDSIKRSVSIYPEMEIVQYNQYIYDLSPSIHIVPLVDSIFTRCKSNISFIEGTWAGAVCLCPDIPEFQKDGVVNYKENFGYLLEKLMKSQSFRQENYEKAYQYIQDNLLFSIINQKRIKIIEEVLK
jgi:hypothetical protein